MIADINLKNQISVCYPFLHALLLFREILTGAFEELDRILHEFTKIIENYRKLQKYVLTRDFSFDILAKRPFRGCRVKKSKNPCMATTNREIAGTTW